MIVKKEVVENGIVTFELIARDKDAFALYQINLDDGDNVVICGYHATGILKIRDALSPENKQKMNDRTVLELLFLYEEAIKDGTLSEPRLMSPEHKKSDELTYRGYTTLELFPYIYDKKGRSELLEKIIFRAVKSKSTEELEGFLLNESLEFDSEIAEGNRI